ncbi:hypothetical protein [Marinicrinis lubricantis]|uniref:Uncharacterized protein n=1 Tax=Marinicrinis lubricantis TaxID=2086470 RepID=A0ABW1IM40_9BACL
MNNTLIISIIVIIYFTYLQLRIIRNKEAPRNNLILAWCLYGMAVIAIVVVNILFTA